MPLGEQGDQLGIFSQVFDLYIFHSLKIIMAPLMVGMGFYAIPCKGPSRYPPFNYQEVLYFLLALLKALHTFFFAPYREVLLPGVYVSPEAYDQDIPVSL